ncbi:MAG: hypothetical protein U0744_15525 [Gemmataceae bacterium]
MRKCRSTSSAGRRRDSGLGRSRRENAAEHAATLLKQPVGSGAMELKLCLRRSSRRRAEPNAATAALQTTKPTDDAAPRLGMRTLVALGVSPPSAVLKAVGRCGPTTQAGFGRIERPSRSVEEGDPTRGEASFVVLHSVA